MIRLSVNLWQRLGRDADDRYRLHCHEIFQMICKRLIEYVAKMHKTNSQIELKIVGINIEEIRIKFKFRHLPQTPSPQINKIFSLPINRYAPLVYALSTRNSFSQLGPCGIFLWKKLHWDRFLTEVLCVL